MFRRSKTNSTKSTATAKRGAVNNPVMVLGHESIEELTDTQAVALGLSWSPIVSGQYSKSATQAALQAKASHYVYTEGVGFVGTAVLPSDVAKKVNNRKSPLELLSLASLFVVSQAKDVNAAYVLDLFASDVWLCFVKNGAVQQGFDIVTDFDDAISRLDKLKQQFPDLHIYSNVAIAEFDIDEGFPLASLLDQLHNPEARQRSLLQSVKKSSKQRFGQLPKPLRYFLYASAALGLYYLLGPYIASEYNKWNAPTVTVENPKELWDTAITQGLSKHAVVPPDSLPSLITQLDKVPTQLVGWRLMTVQCDAGMAQKKWNCKAEYETASQSATNAALAKAKPDAWTLDWTPLKRATALFVYPLMTQPLLVSSLKPRSEHLIHTATELQKIQGVLAEGTEGMGKFEAIKVDAPKYSDNTIVAPLPGMLLPMVAKVTVTGPARSSAVLDGLSRAVSWRSVNIKHDLTVKPERNKSVLTMTLVGDIYAKP